jgi:ubiquinone/menaquinone biosynthesis C-methylase UbiE
MRVLNVGGGGSRTVPAHFDGWEQHVLDIDPEVNPDICLDVRQMGDMEPEGYEAIVCSHNLEHVYRHEVPGVLKGFMRVLKPDGFAEIVVPNIAHWLRTLTENGLDLGDVYYRTGTGMAITFHDVLYGWGPVMAQGNLYYAHKCAFTPTMLGESLSSAGFERISIWENRSNLFARGFKPCR